MKLENRSPALKLSPNKGILYCQNKRKEGEGESKRGIQMPDVIREEYLKIRMRVEMMDGRGVGRKAGKDGSEERALDRLTNEINNQTHPASFQPFLYVISTVPLEKQQKMQPRSVSPELSPLDIGVDFTPLPTYKSPSTTSIDFSNLLSPPLQLHEDLKSGCGGQLWPAGMVLAQQMLRYHRTSLQDARMYAFTAKTNTLPG